MSTDTKRVRLRGHHLLCVLGFRGKGYSQAFVENMAQVVGALRLASDSLVEAVARPDDICPPCPFYGDNRCVKKPDSEERIRLHDGEVMRRLHTEEGQVLPWSQVLGRIRQAVQPQDLHTICRDCPWLPLGYCEEGVQQLKAEGAPVQPMK